ncbi:TetR/AcrR family transcriptional regulator [Actinocorallia sp. API 0066]|uniref:TetR/AcrR family transcriptional regulator n=1 Tax=Actinocorallia sp. API 0066 TaxID=2896846 RepID=UPI001E5EB247|nr:TetR/AcrR family transcriptional regulator [Actinocorallia sp. API 0066]MCD0453346.1 TetR/AcrR family transcriptional regulator [Actinocorallia sp. API 0066]
MRRQQSERSDTTKQAIVAAARDLFTAQGYDRTSIDQIAEKAGVSKGALYHHYRDKTEVLAAVYTDMCHDMGERLLGDVRPGADPVEALKAGSRFFLNACAEPSYRQIALIDAPAVLGWARWRSIDADGGGFGLLRQGLTAAADAGLISPDHLEERAHLLIAALIEATLLIARSDTPHTTQAVLAQLLDQQFEDLLPTHT